MTEQARIALAEKMGLENIGDWECPKCGPLHPSRVTYEETCDTCGVPVEFNEFDPFTDPRDAAALRTFMVEQGFGFILESLRAGKGWQVTVYDDVGGEDFWSAKAETESETTARAACEAWGINLPDKPAPDLEA